MSLDMYGYALKLNIEESSLTDLINRSPYFRLTRANRTVIKTLLDEAVAISDRTGTRAALKHLKTVFPERGGVPAQQESSESSITKEGEDRKRGGLNLSRKKAWVVIGIIAAILIAIAILSLKSEDTASTTLLPHKNQIMGFSVAVLILYGYAYQTYHTYQLIDQNPMEMGGNIRKPVLIAAVVSGLLGLLFLTFDPFGLVSSLAKEGVGDFICLMVALVFLIASYFASMMDPGYPGTSIALAGIIYTLKPVKTGPLMSMFNVNASSNLVSVTKGLSGGPNIKFSLVVYAVLLCSAGLFYLDSLQKENMGSNPTLQAKVVKWVGAIIILVAVSATGYKEPIYHGFAVIAAGSIMTMLNPEEGDEYIMIPFLLGLTIKLSLGIFW